MRHYSDMGTVDDYLAGLGDEDRAAISRIYDLAREVVPGLEQGTGYGMPALTYRGKPLLAVMRTKTHIGIYPFSGAVVESVGDGVANLPGVSLAKGTVRFQPSHPLPDDVVRALVISRRDQIEGG